ncbi:uncharacterized protein LOC127078632 [Lathyrus oleraceus]|uniref:uncharacterized protein LOC127078632 n=1 Tax=Pisum sativum TaxID=3888 RepID=UPI0021CF2637|nr:uncharacterized protein LOC127078632 [Pisum sativum]
MNFERALCDLEASVSLIPFPVCKKLDMGDMKSTNVSLHLADGSVKYPIGMLEYVPVRLGEYYVTVDFVMMDIDEDCQIPIILVRSFLAKVGAITDVKRGKLTFKVGGEKIKFILEKLFKNPSLRDPCCLVDLLSECVQENVPESPPTTKLEESLLDGTKVDEVDTLAKSFG